MRAPRPGARRRRHVSEAKARPPIRLDAGGLVGAGAAAMAMWRRAASPIGFSRTRAPSAHREGRIRSHRVRSASRMACAPAPFARGRVEHRERLVRIGCDAASASGAAPGPVIAASRGSGPRGGEGEAFGGVRQPGRGARMATDDGRDPFPGGLWGARSKSCARAASASGAAPGPVIAASRGRGPRGGEGEAFGGVRQPGRGERMATDDGRSLSRRAQGRAFEELCARRIGVRRRASKAKDRAERCALIALAGWGHVRAIPDRGPARRSLGGAARGAVDGGWRALLLGARG